MKRLGAIFACSTLLAAAPLYSQPAGTHGHQEHAHGHAHTAPHGGTLVVVQEEFAHLELVLDGERLTGYALDTHAENAVRLAQKEIRLDLSSLKGKSTTASITLKAVANPLTGEKVGNSSEFAAPASELKGAKQFKGTIRELNMRGYTFKKVPFSFPQ